MKSMKKHLLLFLCLLVSTIETSANQTHVNTANYNTRKAYKFTFPTDGTLYLTGAWTNRNANLTLWMDCRFSNSVEGAPEHIANLQYTNFSSGSGTERIVKNSHHAFEGTLCNLYVQTNAKNTSTAYRLHMEFTSDGALSNATATPKAELIPVEATQ